MVDIYGEIHDYLEKNRITLSEEEMREAINLLDAYMMELLDTYVEKSVELARKSSK